MKTITLSFIALFVSFVMRAQTPTCTLSVTIDSTVVAPCFRLSGGFNAVNGGSCGCSNKLWAIIGGGTAPYTYAWSTGGNVEGTHDTLSGACYVLWNVVVTDANNCSGSASLNVVIPVTPIDSSSTDTSSSSAGIAKYTNMASLKLYPVPATNQLTVSLGAVSNTHIEVYDILGKKMLEQNVSNGASSLTLDVSGFSKGSYFLRVIGSNTQKTVKFIVDK